MSGISSRPSLKKTLSSSSSPSETTQSTRRTSAFSSSPPPPPPKKTIDCSQASVQNFVYMCFMFVFKRFVFAPTHIKIGIYMFALVALSLIRDFRDVTAAASSNYLAQKHNVFNRYFVKLGWAWTLAALVPFVSMTSMVYTSFNVAHMKNHFARIIVATIAWYFLTSSFDLIDAFTGQCSVQEYRTKLDCKGNKHEWLNGFDISGHTFILIYSLLIMVEEVRIFNEWDSFHKKLAEKISCLKTSPSYHPSASSSENVYLRAEYLYRKLTPYIKANFVFMALLALLWEIMLLSTFLFFHTMMHKLLAAFCAILCWFFTYKTWYVNKSVPWSPGLPGDGSI